MSIMRTVSLLLVVCVWFSVTVATVTGANLTSYRFNTTLYNDDNGGRYELYWNFNSEAGTIYFAVRVHTTGWVGFGLSRSGQMPGSDVVIGWVDNIAGVHFDDRYAEGRFLPPIDPSQDWFLVSGEEAGGYTILEFTRNWTTCDDRDLNIQADTARIVWSWQTSDPANANALVMHNFQGSTSLNLLGGLPNPPQDPEDVQFFDITISNALIPGNSDTTYWCEAFQLPSSVRAQERYIVRISPRITSHSSSYVHHILIYLCRAFNHTEVGQGGPCDGAGDSVDECRGGTLIGGWAVGGEDFIYPSNVAYPIGGPGNSQYVVMEMHYDNPTLDMGVRDSSGMRFYYSSSPREHDAGILFLGHSVTSSMIIPPSTNSYTIAGMCSSNCTQAFFPQGGIHIFANLLHTHLVGHGLTLQHLRWNTECNVYEELEPIDQNLQYDFNYQQFTHLSREITVLPGDVLVLRCLYNTGSRQDVTFGGESTRREMCLTFPVYYPRTDMAACASHPDSLNTFFPFLSEHVGIESLAVSLLSQGRFRDGFNAIPWTTNSTNGLEDSVLNGPLVSYCRSENASAMSQRGRLPNVQCTHIIPDPCTCSEPQPCCHRLAGNVTISNTSCTTSPPPSEMIPQSSATPDQTTEDTATSPPTSTDRPLAMTERPTSSQQAETTSDANKPTMNQPMLSILILVVSGFSLQCSFSLS